MFRYHRIEVLGALASVLSSWLVTGILVYEAAQRIVSPVKVNGKGGLLAPYCNLPCMSSSQVSSAMLGLSTFVHVWDA